MQERIQKLQAKMELGLEEINQVPDPIRRYDLSIKLLSSTIEELKAFIATYSFQDKDEEINYFRNVAPVFYSKDFYFIKVYEIEILKRTTSRENLRLIYDQELKEIDYFFARNNEFCRYYYAGAAYLDDRIFSRHNGKNWPLDGLSPVLDSNFSIASHKISWIIANEKYRCYLEKEMDRLNRPNSAMDQDISSDVWTWERSKSDATELVVCLQLSEGIYVNGLPASAAQLTKKFEDLLTADLKDFKNLDYANRSRKKDLTPFMNSMIRKYVDRATRLNK